MLFQVLGSVSGDWALIKILYTYNIQCKFLMITYQDSHLSESTQTWTIGSLGDSILFGGIIHQGPFPGEGLEFKIQYNLNSSIMYKFCMSSLDSY